MDDTVRPAVTNIGLRPTVGDNGGVTVESWLLDFEGNLYDAHIRVEFFTRLREEVRFGSLDALQAQIRQDADAVRRYFAEDAALPE